MPTRMLAPCCALLLIGLAAPAEAKEPRLDRLFPAGGQRGQTVEVQAEGEFDPWPPQAWVSGPGLTVEPGSEPGQLSIQIADDAPAGLVGIRLYNPEGASALRPFCIGTIQEINEVEPNDDPVSPQPIEAHAVTINGRLARTGDVDGYAVELKVGETLVASMMANEGLGSPMDAILEVATPEGFLLAQRDDDHGLDPLLIFQAPADGTYIVRTFAFPATPTSAIQFAGGADFIYRLTITTGGFLDFPAPLAISQESDEPVEIQGWNVPEEARQIVPLRDEVDKDLALVAHPILANQTEVPVVPYPAILESDSNSPENPQAIELPVSITGRIDPERDADVYRWKAQKGQEFLFRVTSRALGFPLDPMLRVLDDSGKVLAEADDTSRDVRDVELRFKAPADGDYRVLIRDLNGQGSPRHAYRLDALIPEPDYRLTVASDRFTLPPDQALEIPVTVQLENGFQGDVSLKVEGLPEGITVETSKPDEAAPDGEGGGRGRGSAESNRTVTLSLRGSLADGWSGPFQIKGQDTEETSPSRSASFALGETPSPSTNQGWLTIPATPEAMSDAEPSDGDDQPEEDS